MSIHYEAQRMLTPDSAPVFALSYMDRARDHAISGFAVPGFDNPNDYIYPLPHLWSRYPVMAMLGHTQLADVNTAGYSPILFVFKAILILSALAIPLFSPEY